MLASTLRDSIRGDDLEIPSRPNVEAVLLGPYPPHHSSAPSTIYRVTLVEQAKAQPSKPGLVTMNAAGGGLRRPLQPKSENSFQESKLHPPPPKSRPHPDIDVRQLEIFACVQRLNRPEITRWKQIAEVDLRKRRNSCRFEAANANNNANGLKSSRDKDTVRSSIRIAGFCPGYRYQIVVRSVGAHGRRSLFSQPVFIIPPVCHTDD